MTNNPLIDKYYEMFPDKKEPLKMPRIEDYEGEETIADELKKPKSQKVTSYDLDSGKDSFLQIAEKVKNSEAQVVSISMERDMMSGTKLTFEVIVYEP